MRPTKQSRLVALTRQITRLDHRIASLTATSDRLANVRLAIVFGLGGATFVGAFTTRWWWLGLVLTVLVFTPVTVTHRRIQQGIKRFTAWRDIKAEHIARMRLDWANIPPTAHPPARAHPYEQDIDLLEVHRLLSTAESVGGRARLYEWLTIHEPNPATIAERQAVVRELIPRSLYRDKLAMVARLGASGVQDAEQSFRQWLTDEPPPPVLTTLLPIMSVLALANISLFVLFIAGIIPPYFAMTFALYAIGFLLQSPHTVGMFQQTAPLLDRLRMLTAVTNYIEQAPYGQSPRLRDVVTPVLTERPSSDLQRLSWLAGAASLQGNVYIWLLLNTLVPWDAAVGIMLYRERARLAARLPRWLDVWHMLEALNALAAFAYRNPAANFPTVAADTPTIFDATALGHPLIPDAERVTNDFKFEELGEVVIITGSNMSGKSSFLRTLGVNLRLAYAGGPVIAERLSTRPMRLFSSIRVTDSLEDGISFFYAEVKRLRALLDAFERENALPLFFLIDEIFRGTNNRERLLGSQAYIQALVGGNGVGLVATHDLELVNLAEAHPPVRNMHFREEVIGGRMAFDYHLRQGPCPTTNALTIMAMEGLPVSFD